MQVTAEAGFPPRRPGFDSKSGHVGFVVDKVALGQFSSSCFGFPSQFSFHQILRTHLSSEAGVIVQLVASIPSGLSLTPSREKRQKKPKAIVLYMERYR
jgi:hypothetical protein